MSILNNPVYEGLSFALFQLYSSTKSNFTVIFVTFLSILIFRAIYFVSARLGVLGVRVMFSTIGDRDFIAKDYAGSLKEHHALDSNLLRMLSYFCNVLDALIIYITLDRMFSIAKILYQVSNQPVLRSSFSQCMNIGINQGMFLEYGCLIFLIITIVGFLSNYYSGLELLNKGFLRIAYARFALQFFATFFSNVFFGVILVKISTIGYYLLSVLGMLVFGLIYARIRYKKNGDSKIYRRQTILCYCLSPILPIGIFANFKLLRVLDCIGVLMLALRLFIVFIIVKYFGYMQKHNQITD